MLIAEPMDSAKKLGQKLCNLISSANSDKVTINLPAKRIELQELLITHSISFLGKAGAILVVTTGSITIQENCSVAFKECSIVMNNTEFTPMNTRSLIDVRNNSELNLLDCMLKVEFGKKLITEINTEKERSDVGIFIQHENEGQQAGYVTIISCSFVGFFSHLICGKNHNVFIQDSSFSKCTNSSILALNPLTLHIERCQFSDVNVTPMEIRLAFGNFTDETHIQISQAAIAQVSEKKL